MKFADACKIVYGASDAIPASLPLPGDKDAYNAAQAAMRAILERNGVAGFESDEFRRHWQTAEDCKNRNGGMPPTE